MKNFIKYTAIFLLFAGFSNNNPSNKITLKDIIGTYSTLGNFYEITIKENYFEEIALNREKIWQTRGKISYDIKTNILVLYEIEYNGDINDKANKWLKVIDTVALPERIPSRIVYKAVKFGYFLHLLPEPFEGGYESIFYCYNSKSTSATLPFPRKEIKKFVKIPTLPESYHQYLVHKVIKTKIIEVINDTTIVVNVGKKNGVIPQLFFFQEESNAEFKVLSSSASTSILQLTGSPMSSTGNNDTWERAYKPQIGHLLTSSAGVGY